MTDTLAHDLYDVLKESVERIEQTDRISGRFARQRLNKTSPASDIETLNKAINFIELIEDRLGLAY